MELVADLRGKRICIDTAPFIYFIEKDPKYRNILRPVFAEIDAGNIEALTSTITLLEVLVLPFRTENESLAEEYREILLHAEGLTTYEIVHEVSELSAKLQSLSLP
jgi:predicted nucleic acid-binding protein